MNCERFDIAIVGSGFAGSLMAMICHRLGRSVILLEKGKHPRFTIGESSTPLANLMLEELSIRYNLPALTPLAKWGTWQEAYPNVACGLKRGFTFYHHTLGQPDREDPNHENQLLVAASPNDRIADTHWYRPEFDQFFVNEAQKVGVTYLEEVNLRSISELEDEVRLEGSRNGQRLEVRARFVIDATGPRGFLHKTLSLPEAPLPGFPETQTLYSHFEGVGNYRASEEQPPYPIDNAAVHHVFDGGWIWALKFNNGITSAGVVATEEATERLRLSEGAVAWQNLLGSIPNLQTQFANAQPIRPFTYVSRLPFRSGATSGKRWVQLPSAAGFVDPLLSTGFALTLLGIGRLATIIERNWGASEFSDQVRSAADESEKELLATAKLIGSLYKSMNDFPVFVALSSLYFTAVIYSETAKRLGKLELAPSFLLHNHPYFGPMCVDVFKHVQNCQYDSKLLCADIIRSIEPLNLAGLGLADRRNWYPVEVSDLFENAWKVEATTEEITALLDRSGFNLPKLAN